MKPAMGGDILGTATSGKIIAAIATVDTNGFMRLVTQQSFKPRFCGNLSTAVKKWFREALCFGENPPKVHIP
jgi:hypothetical protein